MSFAEVNPSKPLNLIQTMDIYRVSMQMSDDAPFTVPSWFLREILEDYLSRKHLSDLSKEIGYPKGLP